MKLWCLILVWLIVSASAVRGEDDFDLLTEDEMIAFYREEAQKDAHEMVEKYKKLDKPLYENAFVDYQRDLRIIAVTGTAPDNEELYDDLEKMNSEDVFEYVPSEKFNYLKNSL